MAVPKPRPKKLTHFEKKQINRVNKVAALPALGKYKLDKANAKNIITKERLNYKIKKRGLVAATANAADAENTVRERERQETKRAEIRANKEIEQAKWNGIMYGNPSSNGSNGASQDKSTTSITREGYYIEK